MLPLLSVLQRYLPHLALGLTISLVMVGAYLSVGVASNGSSKVLWSTNPLRIAFLGTNGSGSASESVKCAPKLETVDFHTIVNNPLKISLATRPSGDTSCGPAPVSIIVTAACLVPAGICKGTYAGSLRIEQGYSTILPILAVTIVVN